MSEKKRQKKDGQRKDKKNQAMHESVNERKQQSGSPQGVRDDSTETGTGTTDNRRGDNR